MNYFGVKFLLGFDNFDYSKIKNIFNNLRSALNWRFDENLNAILIDDDIDYQVRDVSNLEMDEIDKIIESFFRFNFEDIVNVPLYRFLVLKNNNELKILANISSLIFDYSSINDFYELFDDLNKSYPKKDLDNYYNDVKDYLNSPNFKKDSQYWTKHIFDSGNYVNFYNLKNNDYKSRIISVDKDSVSAFIESHDCSLFDFYGSVFSLYLSRINRIGGCLLKTIVPSEKSDYGVFDKTTLLKIDVKTDDSFNELLNEFGSALKNSLNHTSVDVENYLDENVSYYSIYDFNDLNENIRVFTGEFSALTLNIYENSLELTYNCDLFSDIYVEHMVKNIESLISNILNSPNQATGNVDILSDEEKALLSDYCKGKTVGVEDKIFSEAFRENAMANPDAIAVDDGINKITYGELEKSSNSVAKDLYENHDIGPGSHVALMFHRDYHYPEFILALNKIGAAYIPIDLLFPANRIEHLLNIGEAKNLITTKDIGQNIDLNVNVIYVEDLKYDNDAEVEILGESDDLFAIIFTSGTTGLPKGVMFHNRQFPWGGAAFEDMFNFSHGDAVGSYFSFSFVAALIISISLYLGGSVRLFNENEQKNSLLLINALKENPMNSLILPPSVGIPIFENEDLQLDYLVLAGAKLNELSKKDRHTKLVNFYGTTEVIFAVSKIYDIKNIKDNRVPIGRPVPNTWAYILDKNGNRMPIGVPGEICISGGMVSGGYYNDCESTSDVFLDNPFTDCTLNEKMYRTGDIGFYNYDGEIEIIGREDNQLSVRGFRIESNEILAIMKSFKEISDIYLDVDNDNLIAYYATQSDLDINEVKEALKDELPYYMIPSLFMELEEIPLNINGKIDKSSLKTVIRDEDVEISDDILSSVVYAFKEVLNQDVVLIDDDFVSLGGNSLSAMKLQLLLKEKLGISLSSNELMDLSTPQDIANHIKFNLNVHSTADEEKYTFDNPCPLSESQLNVYLDEKANEKGTAYSTPGIFEYDSAYSIDEITDAIHALINKHPILMGRILDTDGIPLLICDNNPTIETVSNVGYHDLIKPFDLDKSLARFFIADNEDGKFVFYDMHHIISDATSRSLINRELEEILTGNLEDKIDLGFAYASRDSFESKYGPKYKSAQKFFQDTFADIDDVQYFLEDIDGSTGSVSLPIRGIRRKVESFTQKNGITTSNLLNAVFAYTYSRFTGSNKVCYNFTEHGRHEDYLKDALGMFVRTVPIIIDCENRSVSDFVTDASDLILKSMANSSYPFRLLVREFNLTNDVVFEYNYDLVDFDIGNDIVVSEDADSVSEFLCVVNDLDDGFVVSVSHLDKFSQHTAKQFVKVFREILIQILEKENLADISYISAEDIELLNDYNQTEHQFVHKDILDAFNDNLPKHENNILVGYNNRSYTHGQGAFIASVIGDKLNNSGIVKQDYVALFVNRSEWFLLASMGVLSVGGIYVPIDTGYPDERVIFMIEDTKSKIVLVDNDSEERMKNIIAENDLNIDVLNVSNITSKDISSSNHLNSVEVDDEDIACVLYTSGTTGVPKGVLVTRKAINNFVSWYVDETNFTSSDIYGMHCSYVFDIHTAALYSPVITGGSLYVVPEDIRLDLKALNDYYVEHGCTHTNITSQVGKLFAERDMETTIKLLCFGGMKLGELNAPDSIGPFESYGPSENLAISTSIFANKRINHSSIGRFISNVKGYVLDNELRRVPLGAQGELYLTGAQLTPGYLNRAKENGESFFDNPFDDKKGYERIYKTGDIVRFLPDGTLGIVGRRDSQVKIRGNRVELTEVESSIRSMDIVEDVTVQTIKNNANNELVAYVVINNNLDDGELKDSICSHVNVSKPEYMVPSYVVKLDSIPLNVNGKVDKRALPDVDRTSLHAEYVAPRDENEKEIVEAFQKALNLEKVGIYDDFIRLGGDSLTAIRLLSYIKSNDITMADILTFRTPEAIAKNMSDFSFDLDLYTLESGCPLNAAQLNVFADVTVYNKKNAYHIPGYIPIPKEHNLEDILSALDEMLNAHPILGMRLSDRYEVNDADDIGNLDIIADLITTVKKFGIGEIINIIRSFGLRDMGGLYNMIKTIIRLFKGEYPYMVKGEKPPISVKSEADTGTIIDFFAESLDIYNNLSKFMIIETEDSYYLLYLIHHIIFDAVSAGVFKNDFEILLDGGSVSLDDTFLKASAYTQQIKSTDKFEEASEYYYPILSSIDDVGTLVEDNSSEGYSMSTWDLKFDKNAFKSFLNNAGISENVLFTSVFAYALSQFVDGDKVLFTLIENGRDRFSENFIGMTSNVMPLVADCKDQSINSFMENMADTIYGISRHSYYPILLLYQKYDFEVNTLFQFIPNWIADEFDNVEIGEDIDSEEIINHVLNNYGDYLTELLVQVYQNGDSYRLLITNSNKYSNKLIEDLKDTFISILSNIINMDLNSNLNATLK